MVVGLTRMNGSRCQDQRSSPVAAGIVDGERQRDENGAAGRRVRSDALDRTAEATVSAGLGFGRNASGGRSSLGHLLSSPVPLRTLGLSDRRRFRPHPTPTQRCGVAQFLKKKTPIEVPAFFVGASDISAPASPSRSI